jgi:hypothetical protein
VCESVRGGESKKKRRGRDREGGWGRERKTKQRGRDRL